MIIQLMALPKVSGSARIRAELETIIEQEGIREYARVYTDGSVMDERSGCAIVMGHREVESIFNEEAQAIIEAIKITRRWGLDKHIIMTDSLSNMVAQEETFTRGNSKKMVLKDLMAEEVLALVCTKGNETVDKAAKEALNQAVDNSYKVVMSDWSKRVERKSWQSWNRDYGWDTQTSHTHTD
jgi:hypothetical protein